MIRSCQGQLLHRADLPAPPLLEVDAGFDQPAAPLGEKPLRRALGASMEQRGGSGQKGCCIFHNDPSPRTGFSAPRFVGKSKIFGSPRNPTTELNLVPFRLELFRPDPEEGTLQSDVPQQRLHLWRGKLGMDG